MHTFTETGTGVPAFLAKLWRLVEDPSTDSLITWSPDGGSFIIQNQAQFARELLPLNYKHNNMASFIRQLNMYGFHKITSIDNGGLKFDRDEMEFSHSFFQRGYPYLLEHIKRKIANQKQTDEKGVYKPEAVNKVLNEVKQMRGRQDSLDTRFSSMKQENEALWKEIAMLRQKHMKQQQMVNKLIQFLVTIVQPQCSNLGGGLVGVKRRIQLMINDAPQDAKMRRTNDDDCSGPVIRELGEELLDDMRDSDSEIEMTPKIDSPRKQIPKYNSEKLSSTTTTNPTKTSIFNYNLSSTSDGTLPTKAHTTTVPITTRTPTVGKRMMLLQQQQQEQQQLDDDFDDDDEDDDIDDQENNQIFHQNDENDDDINIDENDYNYIEEMSSEQLNNNEQNNYIDNIIDNNNYIQNDVDNEDDDDDDDEQCITTPLVKKEIERRNKHKRSKNNQLLLNNKNRNNVTTTNTPIKNTTINNNSINSNQIQLNNNKLLKTNSYNINSNNINNISSSSSNIKNNSSATMKNSKSLLKKKQQQQQIKIKQEKIDDVSYNKKKLNNLNDNTTIIDGVSGGKNLGSGTNTKNNQLIINTGNGTTTSNKTPMYINQVDFVNAEMPNELFDDENDLQITNSKSPLIGGIELDGASSSNSNKNSNFQQQGKTVQSTIGESSRGINNGGKRIENNNDGSSSSTSTLNPVRNDWAVSKMNKNNELLKLSTPADIDQHLDNFQGELDSLKDLLRGEGFTVDPNSLLGVNESGGKTGNKTPKLIQSPYIDFDHFVKLFADSDVLSPYTMQMPEKKYDDPTNSSGYGSELMAYNPQTSVDLFDMFNESNCDAADGNGTAENICDIDEIPPKTPDNDVLNTPYYDKEIIFKTK